MGYEPKRLTTPRMVLEPSRAEHGEGMWRAVQRSQPELAEWMVWAQNPKREDSLNFFRAAEGDWTDGRARHWVLLPGGETEPGGHLSLQRGDDHLRYAEIGYWIRSDLTGRGLTTEAASAVVDYAFEEAGLHRIELRAAVGNHASLRIAEKLGFQREGTIRHGTWGRTGWIDMHVFGLLETDPRPTFHRPEGF